MVKNELFSSVIIIFKWNFEDEKYHCYSRCQLLPDYCCHQRETVELDIKLSEFNDMIQKSPSFPCTSFVFLNGSLENYEAQRFFNLHGDKIRSLELVEIHEEDFLYCCSSTPKRILCEILTEKAPFITHLSIGGYNYHHHHNNNWELDESDDLIEELTTLKTFSWHADLHYTNHIPYDHSSGIAQEILRSSPNLIMIKDFNVHFDLEMMQQQVGKTSPNIVIEHLTLDDTVDPSQLITFLTIVKPRVKSLQLVHSSHHLDRQRDYLKGISMLCQSCQNWLKIMDLSQFSCCADIQLPQMPNVVKLSIGSEDGHHYSARRCFPSSDNGSLNFAHIFPNLETLDCRRLKCEDDYWSVYYPKMGCQLRHVETVVVSQCSTQWMENLRGLCPHFGRAVVHCVGGFEPVVNVLKVWTHLECLEVRVEEWGEGMGEFSFDAAITGMPEGTIERVREEDDESVWAEEVKDEKGHGGSIASLKKLRDLKIVFEHPCLGKLVTLHSGPILSDVSALYGFCQIPELKVTILYDHTCQWATEFGKKFESLSPFVSFKHRQDQEEEHRL